MKNILKTLLIISLTFVSYSSSFASTGNVQEIGTNMVQNGVATAGASAYTSQNSARCSSRRFSACIRAMMGALQIVQLVRQLMDSGQKQQAFGIGELPSLDDLNGLCLNPQSSGCTQDVLDVQISDTPIGEALKTGSVDDLLDAAKQTESDMNAILSDLESKGFTVDQEAGTFTGPNGQTQSLASLASDPNNAALPSNVSDALSNKLASIGESASGSAANASKKAGGATGPGGIKFVDEFLDDGLNGKRGLASLKNKKDKTNEDFLAAMADKAGDGAVGVAGDDIFKMIQRRYNKKKKTKEFIFR